MCIKQCSKKLRILLNITELYTTTLLFYYNIIDATVIHCFRSDTDSIRLHDEELIRRRSASVLEVKEHASSRLKEELFRAQTVSFLSFLLDSPESVPTHDSQSRMCFIFMFYD